MSRLIQWELYAPREMLLKLSILQSDQMFKPHGRIIPMLALATAGCLWGTGFYFGKIALTEMPVASMVLFRFAFASAGLLPVLFYDRPHFDGSERGWVVAASVVGVPVH
jgi:drug/metabolite transporter (DMT)-like permease